MTRDQVLAAAKASGMVVRVDAPGRLGLADPSASGKAIGGASSSGGTGLLLDIILQNNQTIQVTVREQDDTSGFVAKDLAKKWGQPLSRSGRDVWGNMDDVFALCDHQLDHNGEMTVVIHDAKAAQTQTKTSERPGIKM